MWTWRLQVAPSIELMPRSRPKSQFHCVRTAGPRRPHPVSLPPRQRNFAAAHPLARHCLSLSLPHKRQTGHRALRQAIYLAADRQVTNPHFPRFRSISRTASSESVLANADRPSSALNRCMTKQMQRKDLEASARSIGYAPFLEPLRAPRSFDDGSRETERADDGHARTVYSETAASDLLLSYRRTI